MKYALAITFTLLVVLPITWSVVNFVRHVVLVGRLRQPLRNPRPMLRGSKA